MYQPVPSGQGWLGVAWPNVLYRADLTSWSRVRCTTGATTGHVAFSSGRLSGGLFTIFLYVWSVGALFFKLGILFRSCQILSICQSSLFSKIHFGSGTFRIRNDFFRIRILLKVSDPDPQDCLGEWMLVFKGTVTEIIRSFWYRSNPNEDLVWLSLNV